MEITHDTTADVLSVRITKAELDDLHSTTGTLQAKIAEEREELIELFGGTFEVRITVDWDS